MKTLKRLIVLVVCFVLLSNSFSMSVSASGLPGEPVYPLVDDLIEEGFVLDDYGNYVSYEENDSFSFRPFLLSRKNFPDFDINSLPWQDFPAYVKNIFKSDKGYYYPHWKQDTNSYSCYDTIPFALIRPYSDNLVEIYVGYNIFIGEYNDSVGNLNIFAAPDVFASGSKCYSARYDFEGNVVIDWKELPLNCPWGDLPLVGRFGYFISYAIGNVDRVSDYYFWGGNAYNPNWEGNSYSYEIMITLSSGTIVGLNQHPQGFSSGKYWPDSDIFTSAYCTTFTPVTDEQIQQHQQKGIWDTLKSVLEYIKNLPSNIANSIKSFFTSLGDSITSSLDTLKNYILYFQPTKPEHENAFNNILSYMNTFFNLQISNLFSFSNSLDNTLNNVIEYIQAGSGVINSILNGVPILNTIMIFFLAFAVMRKVVGR